MIEIRKEAQDIIDGNQPKDNNLLKNAPHPLSVIVLPEDKWNRPYSRQRAVYPLPWLQQKKFWPSVTRIDDGKVICITLHRYPLSLTNFICQRMVI